MLDHFLYRALIAGIGIALITGPTGCFVVWRRLAYFGETIAHSALLGVALALVWSLNVTLGIFASATLIVFAVFYIEKREGLPTDTILALFAHGGLAVGLVILSFFPTLKVNLHGLLFGDILAVSKVDLLVIWIGGTCALGVLVCIWRSLLTVTVSMEFAQVANLHPERVQLIFGILVAAIIAFAVKIVGILLIVALLVIPAATARKFAPSPEVMAVVAASIGVVSVVGGLYSSAYFDTPSGPSIVVTALLLFILTRIPFESLFKRRGIS